MITARIEVCKYIFLHLMNYISDDVGTAKNNLIGTAAVGVSKLVPLKMNNKALSTSLLFTCLLTDDPEAGRAGPPPYHQAEDTI